MCHEARNTADSTRSCRECKYATTRELLLLNRCKMEEKKLVSGAISSDSNVAIEIVAPSHVASLTSPATQTDAAPASVPDENDKVLIITLLAF